ncbi:hypothetical protein HPP92_024996 [Vanilla planifolia]|uniref:Uncharacterized protein n=1 Tax=Vanilla planifolia TaxID=51239 RepID=A0A835PLE3_VANPL|nr:hypothetical protein HPP92_024996 [Vanilla planifolia]
MNQTFPSKSLPDKSIIDLIFNLVHILQSPNLHNNWRLPYPCIANGTHHLGRINDRIATITTIVDKKPLPAKDKDALYTTGARPTNLLPPPSKGAQLS